MSVVIDNDFKDDSERRGESPADPDALSVEEMIEMVKQAGIVGMGGATFPTHTKISSAIGKVDTVIINGAECEPYITGDHRAMLERPAADHRRLLLPRQDVRREQGRHRRGGQQEKRHRVLNKVIAEQKAPLWSNRCAAATPRAAEKQLCQAITGKQVPPAACPRTSAAPCSISTPPSPSTTHQGRYARGAQGRHRVRQRRCGAEEPRVPDRHAGLAPL